MWSGGCRPAGPLHLGRRGHVGRCPLPVTPSRRDARSRGRGGTGQVQGSPCSSSSFLVPRWAWGGPGSPQGPAGALEGRRRRRPSPAGLRPPAGARGGARSGLLAEVIVPEGGRLPVGHVVSCPEAGTLKLSAQELHSPLLPSPAAWAL